jgi:hypothetical protein
MTRAPRLSEVRDGTPVSLGGACGILVVLGAIGGVGIGLRVADAVPQFTGMQTNAKRMEVPDNVNEIREAELAYVARWGHPLAVSSLEAAENEVTGAQHEWAGGAEWRSLGWAPASPVRGGYYVTVTEDGFEVHGVCDIDVDGVLAHYIATAEEDATRITKPEIY